MSTIRQGQRGDAVRRLQEDLAAAGFSPGDPDGIFGDDTRSAVEAFQRSQGLDDDGVVGPRTAAALAAVLGADPAVPTTDVETEPDAEEGLGEVEGDAPGRATVFPDFFDNWDGELARRYRAAVYLHEASGKKLAWTGRPGLVNLSTRTHVCLHITAVTFGTSRSRRQAWLDRIAADEISPDTLDQYGHDAADPMATATRMALHERFWKAAYHWVGLLNGDILYNNDAARYTYHGNASNRIALGIAAEAVLPGRESRRGPEDTVVDEHFIETNRQTLRLAVTTARDNGAPVTHATAHRCFSPDREGDPGEIYWREVAIPVCAELDVAIDYDLVNGGLPIPVDWDPSSPFDWRGKRVS